MILIGLTGSLATGKSTVSSLLHSPPYNLPIIDADLLARHVVRPSTPAYRQIVQAFGPSTPDLLLPSREINRAALGRRVFGSSPDHHRARALLNGIVHPLVRRAMARAVLACFLRGCWAVVLDVPLLFESGLDIWVSVVLMVAVSEPRVQMARLRDRDRGLSLEEAEARVGSQVGVEEKVGRTRARGGMRGKVLLNDGGREELVTEVGRVMGEVRVEGGGWAWGCWLMGSPYGALGVSAWEMWQGWRARRRWEEETKRKVRS